MIAIRFQTLRTVLLTAVIAGAILMLGILPLHGAFQADSTATPDSGEATQPDDGTPAPPTLTPTLGVRITRTPALGQTCPVVSGKSAVISMPTDKFFDDKYNFVPDPIVAYLNTTGSVDGLKAALETLNFFFRNKVSTVDVTGDGVPEVLLDLTFKPFYGSVLLVLGCRNGAYVTLLNMPTGDQSKDMELDGTHNFSGIRFVQDLNGNGVRDIVFDEINNLGAHGYGSLDYQILEWNGSTLVDLADQNQIGSSAITQSDASSASTLRDHGNGTQELVLPAVPGKYSYYGGSDAERTREYIYAWNGAHFTQYCWRYTEPPKYIADAAMDGDNESSCRHFDAAQRAYQSLIYDTVLLPWNNLEDFGGYNSCCVVNPTLVPDPNERIVLEAYVRYRIILLHAVQNEKQAAAADFDILTKKYSAGQPGFLFVGLARAFMDTYSASNGVTTGCQSAITYVRAHLEIFRVFDIYDFNSGGLPTNAFRISDHLEQICPFT